ncbi:TPA: DUF4888 domain-containing protein [Staphylococcus aureus]|nr:DUF4888 domain-containing protein [Staphylococcus aureus]
MNKKLLTKTLIASALVLTTVGSGFHSSSNYNGINNVAKAAETTDGQLWKNVRDALKEANIIDGNENETIDVNYKLKNGSENKILANGNSNGDFSKQNIDIESLTTINIKKVNISNFNERIDANNTWKNLTNKLKGQKIIKDGDKVTIHSKDQKDPKISGIVGQDFTEHKNYMLYKKDIDKITIN